jgi:hypothetical protein
LRFWYKPTAELSLQVVQASREVPSTPLLAEVGGWTLDVTIDPVWSAASAPALLRGALRLPGRQSVQVSPQFAARDLTARGYELAIASLVVPDIELSAYQYTGNEQYLLAARDYLVSFARFERSAWLPRGLLWNDHAIAARMIVLGRFWQLYRHCNRYDPETGALVLQLAARSAQFLADPSKFTVGTNHGVMQNLALWHYCLVFPNLPDTSRYRQLAWQRLDTQMGFYVNDEGVVLEHSTGYQQFGMTLLARALRYAALLHMPVPSQWLSKYEAVTKWYDEIRRPDGSLPIFGDTAVGPGFFPVQTAQLGPDKVASSLAEAANFAPPHSTDVLMPVAGYSVWWDCLQNWPAAAYLAETLIGWSFFPSQAHKHADEMALSLWAGGQSWLENVGYWPYSSPLRRSAETWPGSNAPHLSGELDSTWRTTSITGVCRSPELRCLDLRRTGPGYVIGREVIHLPAGMWVVLDYTSGSSAGGLTVTWHTGVGVDIRPGLRPQAFLLTAPGAQVRLGMAVTGSTVPKIDRLRGSTYPFAGWQVVGTNPTPTEALRLEQSPGEAWTATIVHSAAVSENVAAVRMSRWESPQDWELELATSPGTIRLVRTATALSSHDDHGRGLAAEITPTVDNSTGTRQLHSAYYAAMRNYPQHRDLMVRRIKVTYVLLMVLIAQELLFLFLGRAAVPLRCTAVLCWIGGGLYLSLRFLA